MLYVAFIAPNHLVGYTASECLEAENHISQSSLHLVCKTGTPGESDGGPESTLLMFWRFLWVSLVAEATQ